ncbi:MULTISPECIES: sigma-E factor negative regulatory protein [Stutzerimonas]|uniref:sigma-E factor negative regulatory protein n=1 Tax=Stutzerimonas TaxID=2901164 RepID=UPI000C435B16|nr:MULTISPECIES: RseA family anti-sigma factor [Stutzerimonas stutzeri subgroup]MAK87097.1 RNA polymerase subunit sigma [Pseudomonas sp.]MBU2330683.1 anti-sigma factor [Gammaproteobacteria bacterium]RRU92157.1 RNA polymerase subunit sigma [Stutzerimonas xanthomarina]UIP35013.1 anti-sigma factor [Stutzerimonas kunmingensis]HCH79012.1 RNA polymerase subunit sigma [Pseudomonas sp.]
MSREALHESLSAVMDNEADELELRRMLAGDNPELRATWSRYQLARAAMHKELIEPRLDIASAVSAALADEAAPVKAQRNGWKGLGRLAVAASVTVAVLAGVRLYNQNEVAGPQLAQQAPQPSISVPQTSQGPAVLAGYSEQTEAPVQAAADGAPVERWHEERLPSYVRQHAQQAAFGNGSESALPYARAASMEER